MKRASLRLLTRTLRASVGALMVVALVLVCLAAMGAARPAPAQAAVARGVCDPSIPSMDATSQAAAFSELGPQQLNASYVRFVVSWAQAEPNMPVSPGSDPPVLDPQYTVLDSQYMAQIATAVEAAAAKSLRVIITFSAVPEWASDLSLWKYSSGSYRSSDAVDTTYLPSLQAFYKAFAAYTGIQGNVYAYECWNEPNLALFLTPQTVPGNANFAVDRYFKMLQACHDGILAGNTSAPAPLIVAGATAPHGSNNAGSTSPQRFASELATRHRTVTNFFNDYSHHPYMPGASPRLWPEAAPAHPSTTVTLENLGTLLKIFPTKHFLLTEYGVQTAACVAFSYQHVDQATQADYLRRAYAYVAKYKQVKLLMWYLLKDEVPAPPTPASRGFYTGLDTASGAHKRAWYVFAGGTTLTLNSPTRVKLGAAAKLTGQLAWKDTGVVAKPVLQSHRAGHPWATVKTLTTPATGAYSVSVRPKASTYYRVAWLGVVTSRSRLVAVH